MAQLNQTYINKIYQSIKASGLFTPADFDIELPDTDGLLLIIKFRPHPLFQFVFSEETDGDHSLLYVTRSPGEVKVEITFQISTYDEIPLRVSEWCKSVYDELRASIPISSDLEDLREKLEQHIKDSLKDPEKSFTSAEIDAISERFDNLYKKFEELREKQQITEDLLHEIRSDFYHIKANAKFYTKGVWASTTKNRVVEIAKKIATSPEARKLMYEGVKKLIGL